MWCPPHIWCYSASVFKIHLQSHRLIESSFFTQRQHLLSSFPLIWNFSFLRKTPWCFLAIWLALSLSFSLHSCWLSLLHRQNRFVARYSIFGPYSIISAFIALSQLSLSILALIAFFSLLLPHFGCYLLILGIIMTFICHNLDDPSWRILCLLWETTVLMPPFDRTIWFSVTICTLELGILISILDHGKQFLLSTCISELGILLLAYILELGVLTDLSYS